MKQLKISKERRTNYEHDTKQLIEAVYEIAFGEDAHLRGFFPEEVVERLQEFSDGSNPILIEVSME